MADPHLVVHEFVADRNLSSEHAPELDAIAGMVFARLHHLGGMQGVKNATLDEIASVPGISKALAEKIFEALKN